MRLVIISALALLCTASFCQDITVPPGTISTVQQYETQGNITAASVQVSPPGRLDLKASGGIYLKSSVGQSVIISGGAGFTAKIVPAVIITQPLDGSTNLTSRPTISATVTSVIRHVDRTTLRLTLDGGIPFSPTPIQWTPVSSTDGGTFTFTPASDLSVGAHTLIVSISDPAGNTANVTTHFSVGNQPPTIVTAAQANPSPTIGMTSTLSVLGADDGGAGNLSYAWTTTGNPPGAVTFSPNGNNSAQSTVATFSTPGTYNFLVTVSDVQGLSVSSATTVIVRQTALVFSGQPTDTMTGLGISPPVAITFKDQNGNTETDVSAPVTISLGTNPSGAALSGNLTTPAVNGIATFPGLSLNLTGSGFTLQASAGGVASVVSSTFNVAPSTNAQPTVENAAAASSGATTNSLVSLSVLGNDDGGESNLTYTWTASPTTVSFSPNPSNSAKLTTAIFGAAGTYNVLVTISDVQGSYITSMVTVNVQLDAPTNLSAVHQGNQIHLAWTDNSNEETSYIVEREIAFTDTFTQIASLSANAQAFDDSTALTTQSYFYRVKAVKGATDSPYSNSASADWPLAPTSLTALAHSATQVLLVWNHSLLNVDNFIIERKDSPTGMFAPINPQPTGTPLQFIDTNVLSYNQYVYRVRAVKGAYPSDPSNEASITLSALPLVKVTTTTPLIGEHGGIGTFTISRTGDTSNPLTVNFSLMGTAQPNLNYQIQDSFGTPISNSVLMPAGTSAINVKVLAMTDNVYTADLSFQFSIIEGAGYAIANASSASMIIEDMDTPNYLPAVSVSVTQSQPNVFHVQNQLPTYSFQVQFATSGSAVLNTDYFLWDKSTYPNGQPLNTTTINIPSTTNYVDLIVVPVSTALHSTGITATLSLLDSPYPPYYHIIPQGSATVSLPPNAPTIDIAAIAPTIQEGGNVQNAFAVTITGGNLAPTMSGTIAVLNQILTPSIQDSFGASQPWPWTAGVTAITYNAVAMNYTITLNPPDDLQPTGDRTITYSIGAPANGLIYQIANTSAHVVLKDNASVVSMSVVQDQAYNTYPGKFTFTKQGIVSSVNFNVVLGSNAGVRGIDYALYDTANQLLTGNTVTFPAGQNTSDVYVYALIAEPQTKFATLALTSQANMGVGSPNQGTVTLRMSAVVPPAPPPLPPSPPTPDCTNPISVTIQNLIITGGTTGDGNGSLQIGADTKQVWFTKNTSITVSVSATAVNGTVGSITITGGSDALTIPGNGAANGTFTGIVKVANEGIVTLYASVTATNTCGDSASASLADRQEKIVVVDRTPPSLVYTLPDRHSATDDKDAVYLNGSTEIRNAALRADRRSNCWTSNAFEAAGLVSDLSGLSTSGTMAILSGPETRDLNVAFLPPTANQPNYTIQVDSPLENYPSDLMESIVFGASNDPFQVAQVNGHYTFDIILQDRCGNAINTQNANLDSSLTNPYKFKIWVDRTPPPVQAGTNCDDVAYNPVYKINRATSDGTNSTTPVFSKNLWYIVSTYDAAEAWQDFIGIENWMHVAYHHPVSLPDSPQMPASDGNALATRSILGSQTVTSALAFNFTRSQIGGGDSSLSPRTRKSFPSFFDIEKLKGRSSLTNELSVPGNNSLEMSGSPADPTIISKEITPFILRRPVLLPCTGLNIVVRDSAGNYSDQVEPANRTLLNVARDQSYYANNGHDQEPQFADAFNFFQPDVMDVPPSFSNAATSIGFTIYHPTYSSDFVQQKGGNYYLSIGHNPAIGVVLPSFEASSAWSIFLAPPDNQYGYTDLLEPFTQYLNPYQSSGTIPFTQYSLGAGPSESDWPQLWRSPIDPGWQMKRDMQPGLTRTIDNILHTGFHWGNTMKLSPDVAATGTVVTLRIGAGYIKADRFDKNGNLVEPGDQGYFLSGETIALPDTEGDYVHIGNGLLARADRYATVPNDPAKITILRDASPQHNLLQRLVPDPNEPSLLQWIELTVEIGANVQADLYDVKVNLENVQNHTMAKALSIIKMEVMTVDPTTGDIKQMPNLLLSQPSVSVSLEYPELTISDDPIATSISGSLHLTGTITSGMCDITPGNAGSIDSAILYLNGNAVTTLPLDVTKLSNGSFPRPYAYQGNLDSTVSVSDLIPGPNRFRVEVCDKGHGYLGASEFQINIGTKGGTDPDPTVTGLASLGQPYQVTMDFSTASTLADLQAGNAVHAMAVSRVSQDAPTIQDTLTAISFSPLILSGNSMTVTFSDTADISNILSGVQQTYTATVSVPVLSFAQPNFVFRRAAYGTYISDYWQAEFTYNPDNPGQITFHTQQNSVVSPDQTLFVNSETPLQYRSADSSLIVKLVGTYVAGGINGFSAIVTSPTLSLNQFRIDTSETGVGTHSFKTSAIQVVYVAPATDDDDTDVPIHYAADTPVTLFESADTDFHPIVIRLSGEENTLRDYKFKTFEGERSLIKHTDGNFYLANDRKDKIEIALAVVHPLSDPLVPSADMPDALEDALRAAWGLTGGNDVEFGVGFAIGFYQGGSDLVTGVAHLGWICAKYNTSNLVSQAGTSSLRYFFDRDNLFRDINTGIEDAKATAESLKFVAKLGGDLQNPAIRDNVFAAILSGNPEVARTLSPELQIVVQVASQWMKDEAVLAVNSPKERGRICGRIVFEVVLLVAPYVKAGKLAELTKSEAMIELLSKVKNLEGVEVIKDDAVVQRMIKIAEELATTKMCFVAGTPILTKYGQKAIEEIDAGDWVLSRDERTQCVEYKQVLGTVITHPTTLYHIFYRRRQIHKEVSVLNIFAENESKDAELVCTGEHPFWIVDKRHFVAAKELRIGDKLLDTSGDEARIYRVEIEDAALGHKYTTYNFEVQDFHTYFAGETPVWVHNAGALCQKIASIYINLRGQGVTAELAIKELETVFGKTTDAEHLGDALEAILRKEYPAEFANVPQGRIWSQGQPGNGSVNMWEGHFIKHVRDKKDVAALGVDDAITYVRRAKALVETPVGTQVGILKIGLRANGQRVVMNLNTGEFVIKEATGELNTYFAKSGTAAERLSYWRGTPGRTIVQELQ